MKPIHKIKFPAPIKKLLTRLAIPTLKLISFICTPYFVRQYKKQMDPLAKDHRFFFMCCMGYGIYPYHLDYCWLWNQHKDHSALVVLCYDFDIIHKLKESNFNDCKLIYPFKSKVLKFMNSVFGPYAQELFYIKLFTKLKPIYINQTVFTETPLYKNHPFRMEYSKDKDPHYSAFSKYYDKQFLQAYIDNKTTFSINRNDLYEYFELRKNKRPLNKFSNEIGFLKKHLNFSDPFVVININSKIYTTPEKIVQESTRTIKNPSTYNPLIDLLISSGFTVVMQGRKEQPLFPTRKGLVNYAHSPYGNAINDFALYANCEFVISSKSGPESMGMIYDKPTLSLNCVELSCAIPNTHHRFFNKRIMDKNGKILSWKEILSSPVFFNVAFFEFGKDFTFLEMDEKDIVQSGREFIDNFKHNSWELTPLQKEYKKTLTPLHMDLYHIQGVPSDCYLASSDQKPAF